MSLISSHYSHRLAMVIIEVKQSTDNKDKWGLFVNGNMIGDAKLKCDAELQAKILIREIGNEQANQTRRSAFIGHLCGSDCEHGGCGPSDN